MSKNNIDAEGFEQVLDSLRRNAPAVGLAALSGKSPNRALQQSFKILSEAGVKLTRGHMNYPWRSLQKANPRLAHSIEEVLVFGDSLFTAIGNKQSPESLKADFLEVKQRFAKIVKETESLAMPKEEKSLFSFFDKGGKKPEEKTEIRLTALDQLLEEAHVHSRNLLEKTENDLLVERSFHKAVEWYVLALEDAEKRLNAAQEDGSLGMPESELAELIDTLGKSQIITKHNMASSDRFLRIKEDLHNKSISFLTAHENTFTVIQGHLRSWKDIKTQTEALNALADTVKAGTALLSSASVGVDGTIPQWNGELLSKETLNALGNSFGDYDKSITQLVTDLNNTPSTDKVVSHWDKWDEINATIVKPALEAISDNDIEASTISRPVLKKTDKNETRAFTSEIIEAAAPAKRDIEEAPQHFAFAPKSTWTVMDKMVVNKKLAEYARTVGLTLSSQVAESFQWTPTETMARVSAPLLDVSEDFNIASAPLVLRSQIDYVVRYGNPFIADWDSILNQKVLVTTDENWAEQFTTWMSKKDDLDWAYMMQWNDLVYDLLIMEEDGSQKREVLNAQDANAQKIKEGLINRIADFANNPGVGPEQLKEWGLTGLITRYAIALNMDNQTVDKLWALWHNPKQPIDWNEEQASKWAEVYNEDMATQAGQRVVNQLLDTNVPEMVTMEAGRIKARRSKNGDSEKAPRPKSGRRL